jgi:hypothetical protein
VNGTRRCFACGQEGHWSNGESNVTLSNRGCSEMNANGFCCGPFLACPSISGSKYNGRTAGATTSGRGGRGGTAKRGRERAASATSTTTTTKRKRGRPPKKSSFAAADGC